MNKAASTKSFRETLSLYLINKIREMKVGYQNYLMILPYISFFILFTVLPVLIALILGLTDFNMIQFPSFVGWQNYIRMILEDDIFITAMKNTFIFAIVTGPTSYIVCFILAWMINDFSPKIRAVITMIFYAPALTGQAFIVWIYIFSPDQYGILNGILIRTGIIKEAIGWLTDPKYILGVVILVQLWMSLGTGFLAFIAGLQGVDRSLYESGYIDGVRNRFQELWYITLPSMIPQMIFSAVMQIVVSFSSAEVSMRLAGFPSTEYAAETIVTHIIDYGTIRYEMGYASAMASVLFVFMLAANKAVNRLLKNVGS